MLAFEINFRLGNWGITALSTLIAWLWICRVSVAWQCVCDFVVVIPHGLTTLIASYKKHLCHLPKIGFMISVVNTSKFLAV